MPRTAEDNELIRTARRDEIFRAAGRVFAKKGFAATKIADIASEAGLSHGLLYHYFSSKEAVYAALLEEIIARKPSRTEVLGNAKKGMERLERMLGHWLANVSDRPELALVVAQALLSDTLPKDVRAEFLRFRREFFHDFVEDIAAAQAEGSATRDVDAEELAVTLIATMRGLALVRFADKAVADLKLVTPRLETILRIVRASPTEAAPRPSSVRREPPRSRRPRSVSKENRRAAH